MNDKDVLIKQLMQRIESPLKKMQQLEAENLELKERIARLEKNSATSSRPPSSDIIHPQPTGVVKKKKRKRGGQAGHPKHTRRPFPAEVIDETIVYKLSARDIRRRNLVEIPQTRLALQQISLPKKRYRVGEHRVQLYQTPDGKIVSAILPPSIRKTGLFSSEVRTLVSYFEGRCHMSYSTLRVCFKTCSV